MKQQEINYLNELKVKNSLDDELSENLASEQTIHISDKTRQIQVKMKILFEKQKLAGGIIEDKKDEIIILNVCIKLIAS